MQDDPLEPTLQDAAFTYHTPPELDAARREAMWRAIESAHFDAPALRASRRGLPAWIGLAAAVVIGIGLGRFTPLDRLLHPAAPATSSAVAAASIALPMPSALEPTTSQYLGQTAALLLALPAEARGGRADGQFIGRASNLLLTTRLLLDSPAARDPKLRRLFDDLEVVLAQIVRLQAEPNTTDLDLINQALEQRDVLPRLRMAAADLPTD